jgi:hypothetical protein
VIQVTKITVRSFTLDWLDLSWEISPVAGPLAPDAKHAIFDYQFFILRSGDGVAGPYQQIGGPLRDTYTFRDTRVTLLHKWRHYFYKIKVVHVPSGNEAEFGPAASLEAEPDLIASEINRMEDVLLREFVGRKCWLFPKRTFGPMCTCFDPTLGRKTRSQHAPCFGTGWLGGYMTPIEVYVQIDPSPKSKQANSTQELQTNDAAGRMISFPPVSPGDILVESENRRWKVMSVSMTERLRSVLHQEIRLHEIPKGDIEYELPINVDAQALQPASERNFSNLQSIGVEEDYSDIVNFWKTRGSQ